MWSRHVSPSRRAIGGDSSAVGQTSDASKLSAAEPEPKLWTLKATFFFGTAAVVCMKRFLPVFYNSLGISLSHIGALQVIGLLSAFVGSLFWSWVVNKTGDFKTVLVVTSVGGTALSLMQLLPDVHDSLFLLYVITAASNLCLCTGGPIIDALCLAVLHEDKNCSESYGEQRLWCSIGGAMMSLLLGPLLDAGGMHVGFLGFASCIAVNLTIVALWLPTPKQRTCDVKLQDDSSGEAFTCIINFEVLWFFVNLVLYGVAFALVENFLLVYLRKEFDGSSNLLLGSAGAVMCAFEVPAFIFFERLWNRYGLSLTGIIAGCQLLLVLRCLMYHTLPEDYPGLVLLIEPLHGMTFAGMWCTTVEYGRRLASPHHLTTMQSILSGLYYYVALGTGSAMWSVVAEPPERGGIGIRNAFLFDASLVLIWSIVWLAGLEICSSRSKNFSAWRVPEVEPMEVVGA